MKTLDFEYACQGFAVIRILRIYAIYSMIVNIIVGVVFEVGSLHAVDV